jgi:hypothetical protein
MASQALCPIPECGKPLFRTYGICHRHYLRKLKYGDVNGGGRLYGVAPKWLHEHASHEDDACLIWPFGRMKGGYGAIWFREKTTPAHRAMCVLAHGEPPTPKHHAVHSCGQGHAGCVNPQHLRWATAVENYADAIAHGTAARGPRNGHAKLSEDDVQKIRDMLGVVSITTIARTYCVTFQCIDAINKGNSWAWLI